MTKSESRMQLPEVLEDIVREFARPCHDPKSHRTHKEIVKQITWLYEDIVRNDYIQTRKGFYKLMVYRVNNFEWIWSAFSDNGFDEGFDPLDAHRNYHNWIRST